MKNSSKIQKLPLMALVTLFAIFANPYLAQAQWGTSGNSGSGLKLGTTSNDSFSIYSNNTARVWVKANGNIGIGTSKTGTFKLSVDGNVRAREVVINSDTWADYVFDKGYGLMDLKVLEAYIAIEKHLPGVPSTADVKDKGVSVGEMNKILLQKVEELTLYMIAQQKEIDALKKEIEKH